MGGSIVDARNAGAGDNAANVLGRSIYLDANGAGASIGTVSNDLEIDSRRGSPANTDYVGLEATNNIYLTETAGNLRLVLAHTYTGDIRLTVRESAALGEDFELLPSGTARFAENNMTAPGNHPDAPRVVPRGQIFAEQGSVLLLVGDNVNLHQNSEIMAAHGIDIYGDVSATNGDIAPLVNLDPGFGTNMLLRGRIIAGAVVTPGSQAGGAPVGSAVPALTAPVHLTQIWGNSDVDTFQFGDPSGASGGTTHGDDGYIFIGSKTRVRGSQNLDSSVPDGEDRFLVYYLQDAAVTTGPATGVAVDVVVPDPVVVGGTKTITTFVPIAAEHTLTLDGQAGSDTYKIYSLGSNGPDERNYVINVLDTGAPDDGADELYIFGYDSPDNGVDPSSPTGEKFPVDDIFLLRAARFLPNETADKPGYVAILHGSLAPYRDTLVGNEDSVKVQRINYDRGVNGRLTVYGMGGNDAFFSDDTTVIVRLDGGAGDDIFQIGQIFGLKRDQAEGRLLEQDVFPNLIPTTRGWLSPGIGEPMVVQGGTGDDEFTVYANQAELRLEGDDDNDLFVVRAFALAAVVDTDANNDGLLDINDILNPTIDVNGDGVINAADAKNSDDWRDWVLVTDEDGVAVPIIGLGFSTARPVDIRAGGGDDEVQYNVNAPVSVDGGTGFNKLVILGTEFADDFVITDKGIFGAGVNVRFTNIQVVEVDGLEGDDEFFVQSTAFGVSYRVVGGLGSDTINVTGDVVEDIVMRELEGVSGAVDHLVRSTDPRYNGLIVDGFDYHVASSKVGGVVITEPKGFTSVAEGGGPTAVDSYFIRLAEAPTHPVYVTVSLARSPQEEEDDTLVNPFPLHDGPGDSIWISKTPPAVMNNPVDADFQRLVVINGVPTLIPNRAVVLTFTPGNWHQAQQVFIYAPDDNRSEGDRVVVSQHTVISADDTYDGMAVRNVEVAVRDNDTPGIRVTEIEQGSFDPMTGQFIEDRRTLVIEGDAVTELRDELLVQLATGRGIDPGDEIVVRLNLDEDSDQQIRVFNPLDDPRFDVDARTITFTAADWDKPVLVSIGARNDFAKEDPFTAVISFVRDADLTIDANGDYLFPNLRSGHGLIAIEVIDNDTPGAVILESGGNTLLIVDNLDTVVDETKTDDYFVRLTMQPAAGTTVEMAVITDGLADVLTIDGNPVVLQEIGGLRPAQLFKGSIIFGEEDGKGTLTRGTGADLGSFADEGFKAGGLIRIFGSGALAVDDDYIIESVTEETITLTTAFTGSGNPAEPTEVMDDVVLSNLTREGIFEGHVELNAADRQLIRTDMSGWLADGFVEGQRVRVTNLANPVETVDLKIAIIRGDNETFDEKLEFTAETPLPAWWTGMLNVSVTRIAAVVVFDDTNWYVQQTVELRADPYFEVPLVRQGVKIFPVSTHLLSKLKGPLAVEGGVTGADRSLKSGLKLPGEADDFPLQIGAQPPESQQIDVLNIFNDSSRQNRSGQMTQTTLTGFGMARDLDFAALLGIDVEGVFGESAFVPGGISFGKVNFGDGGFGTDANQSTVEVVNLMLGQGNDQLDILGTLNPAPPVSARQGFDFTPDGAGGGTIERRGFDWKGSGFLVGQAVTIEDVEGTFLVVAIDDFVQLIDGVEVVDPNDNSILVLEHLSGETLPALTGEVRTVIGIDKPVITAGSFNFAHAVSVTGIITVAGPASNAEADSGVVARVTATVGGEGVDWRDAGFLRGQTVTFGGHEYTIVAILPIRNPVDITEIVTPNGILVLGSGPALTLGTTSGTVTATVPGFTVTRSDNGKWDEDGFIVGHLVKVETGGLTGHWRLVDIFDGGKAMTLKTLADAPLPEATGVESILSVAGQHGGLTVVHGGGNSPLEIKGPMNAANDVELPDAGVGSSLTRLDGLAWQDAGFVVGHRVQIIGETGTRLIVGFADADQSLFEDPFATQGQGSVMLLSGPAIAAGTDVQRTVHVADPLRTEAAGTMRIATDSLTRTAGDWIADGFYVGQHVWISGLAGTFTVTDLSATVMGLGTVALAPQANVELTVFGFDPERDGGVRIGGDHVTVGRATTGTFDLESERIIRHDGTSWQEQGFAAGLHVSIAGIEGSFTIAGFDDDAIHGPGSILLLAQTDALTPQDGVETTVALSGIGGPDSPLVIYGDTSQDGVWYSGQPHNVLGYNFGHKPFDPFPLLPLGENEDAVWVFPLANPYQFNGHDIIDASALFAGVASQHLPSVGLTIYGGPGDDLIIGSQAGDHLAGGSGNDTILGQRGPDHIYGDSGVNVDILTRALSIPTIDGGAPAGILPGATFGTINPYPSPVRDSMLAGRDVIWGEGPDAALLAAMPDDLAHILFGAAARQVIWSSGLSTAAGQQGDFDDIIFGDHGEIVQNVADPNLPNPLPQKIQTTALDTVLFIHSRRLQNGGDDTIFGGLGRDILIGGAGHDMVDGGEDQDLIFGDNVYLDRRIGDITNPRFQTLIGGLLYSRSDQDPAHAGVPAPTADESGQLLNDEIVRNYRDPEGAPWWAEYLIDYSLLHNFSFDLGLAGVGSFGNDYLAGGAASDMLFGQLGDDVIQGDGSIVSAFIGAWRVGASRTPGGPDDPLGPLTAVPSFEAATDGDDYIEGGGGADVIFGGLGQDDIVGGSSSFFSLVDPSMRPDGGDYIFGGAGTRIDRNNFVGSEFGTVDDDPMIPLSQSHARDADTIAGDNANIIRIVGTFGEDVNPTGNPATPLYVSFNYDNPAFGYDPDLKIVVRGVTLLDYTPGGPDLRPDLFSLTDPNDPDFRPMFGNDLFAPIWAKVDIGGHDEIHGGSGDDTIYGGGGNNRLFGDAGDDDIIGGWGNDWISGGTGDDGILGDDGRIFTSRNTAGDITAYSEPLYGIHFFLAEDPDPKKPHIIHGNVLNEFIYTPGKVQTATINVGGKLKKTVDLTPFNLTPRVDENGFSQAQDPLFRPLFGDDIIFGGLGDDSIHGGSGDDALSGAEALPVSYAPRFDQQGNLAGLVRIDFDRPWNPGNVLFFARFGEDHFQDSWNAPKPVQSRMGQFYLYDEYDPLRAILFNADGTVWKEGPPPIERQYFLNFRSDEGPLVYGAVAFAPNGTPIEFAYRATDGDDVIFGDLGNDWIVGGTGRDNMYGGWGNDLINADDDLSTNDWLNDVPDTHPSYEDRVFGGAGLDILIGNTGGDRLIDWVGEFNTYLVPFAPFGIATVSRQIPPQLPEFLYALSASDGADPTRATDTGNDPARNGEPDGELGLIVQRDHGLWQDQTGGPTDPQPGNIPGGRRDVLRSADFNDGQAQGLFIDSGDWQVVQGRYQVSPNTVLDVLNIQQHRLNNGNPVVYRHGSGGTAIGGLVDGQTYFVIRLDNHHLMLAATLADAQAGRAIDLTSKGSGTSHSLTSSQRTVSFDPASALQIGGDAVAVMYVNHWLPSYFELRATLNGGKPTGGLKSNAYFIFDYQSPEDFKFAGINISNNKLEMGYRDASGWHVVAQANAQLRDDTDYDVLAAINGTVVTILLQNSSGGPGQGNNISFTYAFPARVDEDGNSYGLNRGMVGLGADNSIARIDNVFVQVLPAEITYERTEDFTDGSVGPFQVLSGDGQVVGDRYQLTSAAGGHPALSTTGLAIGMDSLLQLEATFRTDAVGGIVFDLYGPDDFKFAALSAATNQVLVGHYTARRGWQVDATASWNIDASADYTLGLTLKGTTVSVTVNGQSALGHSFNGLVVDGDFGMLGRHGVSSFDQFTIKTNDPGFATSGDGEDASLEAFMTSTTTDSPNPYNVNTLDVNGDGIVSAADVLLVINWINGHHSGVSASAGSASRYDVNGDGVVSALDVLMLINYLNTVALDNVDASFQGEGEAHLARAVWQSPAVEDRWEQPESTTEYEVDDSIAYSVTETWKRHMVATPEDQEEPVQLKSFNARIVDEALDQWLQELLRADSDSRHSKSSDAGLAFTSGNHE